MIINISSSPKLQKITANFVGTTHYDMIGDKQYLVAPMIMLTEGIHAGSEGPLFYPGEELGKTPQVWNHKPVIVYHPTASDGKGISACDPPILSNRQVGLIMNAHFEDGKLKAEAWLDESRTNKIDERISQAIEKNQVMELSTGLFTDNKDESGEWNGVKYDVTARNFRPDHLALLPDLKGACSIEDGAGFLRLNAVPGQIKIVDNEMSHNNIRSLINSWLQVKDDDVWVRDVYDDFFVFEKNAKLYKGDYTVIDNAVTVTGLFEEVVQVTEYRTPDGKFVGNNNDIEIRKENQMKKEKMINEIITSNLNSWIETDRDTLMKMDDASLEKMMSSEKLAAKTAVENAAKKTADELAVNEKKVADKKAADKVVANKLTSNAKPKTVDEYINDKSVPEAIRNVLKSGVATYNAVQANFIKRIIDNERNKFTEEQLKLKDNAELQMIVNLMSPLDDNEAPNDFSALGVDNTQHTETPMIMQAVIAQDKE